MTPQEKRQATLAGSQAAHREEQARNRRIAGAEKLARDSGATAGERRAAREAAARMKAIPPPGGLPRTLAELAAFKQRAMAARKAKRAARATARKSLADLREAAAS
jgi:hypothetical protein